ncbi:MAG: FtsX-like permease family protein [Anaerolineaceae bacterium]|nr:FtsX-like permease family protein [Anaerolineaceae bacterium]
MTFWAFILRRAARHWQILLTLSLGVMLSTAMLASSPVLVNTVVEFGLRRTLLAADPSISDLRLKAFGRLNTDQYAELDGQVQQMVNGRINTFTDQLVPVIGSRWFHPWVDGNVVAEERVNFRSYGRDDTDIRQHVTFVAGEWPSDPLPAPGVAAVVIGEELAEAYGLEVGDRLPASVNNTGGEPAFSLQISGIVQPIDGGDAYWFGPASPLRAQSDDRWLAQYAALVDPAAFFDVVTAVLPDGSTHEYYWQVTIDPATVNTGQIPLLGVLLRLLREDLRPLSPSITIDTGLDDVLTNFANQSTAVRAPLYFLTAEVVLLTLYYVIMVAALAVRQVEREFAVLQSRGAARRQIFRIQGGEALLISGVALISGPFLGMGLVRAITLAGPLADVGEPGWGLSLPTIAWLAAAVGAIACIIGLLLPVGQSVRRTIVSYQQSTNRVTQAPFWQRTYLDVFVLAIGLVLLWRLQYFGGIVGGGTTRPQVDWLLLLSPLALLVGAGTILLRVFPLLLSFLAAIARRGRGLVAHLAMLQAARNPTHVARLVLLLTLAIALGILSTGINATLDASEQERAAYEAGSDIRLVSQRSLPLFAVESLPDVTDASGVWRTLGSLTIGREFLRYEVLAIDPESFGAMTSYREDFTDEPVPVLLDRLTLENVTPQPTVPLPGQPAKIGLWIWSEPDPEESGGFELRGDSNLDRFGLEVKLATPQQDTFLVELTSSETGYPPDGWRYFEGEIPVLPETSYPVALHSIWLRNRSIITGNFARSVGANMNLAMDSLTVTDGATGETAVVYDFDTLTDIWRTTHLGSDIAFDNRQAHTGTASQALELNTGPTGQVGFLLANPFPLTEPLPALASDSFLAKAQTGVGEVLNLTINSQPMRFEIVGAVNYFPTLYEDLNAGYIITNRALLLDTFNTQTSQPLNNNEAILDVATAVPPQTVSAAALSNLTGVKSAIAQEEVRLNIKADPMALGLRSVTLFGYLLTTALSLVGFATHFYLSAKQKEAIYGVLRSMGMSPGQLYTVLVLEQVVLILFGLAIGTALGVVLNQITLPGLPITFGDRPPTPPFIARNDWTAVLQIYVTLAIAFFISLGIATLLLWRTKLHQVLRVGEE